MSDLSPGARRAATRSRWLAELEAALDHCDQLSRALRSCAKTSEEAIQLRIDIKAAKEEIDRIRRARPRAKPIDSCTVLEGKLATWRGNQIG